MTVANPVSDFDSALPMLGVPREDWDVFARWLRGISRAFGPTAIAHTATILDAWRHLDDYLDGLIERRRRALADDLISLGRRPDLAMPAADV